MTGVPFAQGDGQSRRVIDEVPSIEQALQCRPGCRVREVQLRVEPHGLVIVGRTTSYYDKQLAQRIVKELCGWNVVENRITVDSCEAPTSGRLIHSGNYRLQHSGAEHPAAFSTA